MELRNLIEQFIAERIQDLLRSRPEGDMEERKRCQDHADEVLDHLPPETKAQIEPLMSLFLDLGADLERFLYVEGVRDGIRIAGLLKEWQVFDEKEKGR